ncbi:MAG: hypothetical protein FJ125_15295 [Deltaproteobacteria bacterium]|nr:hypothetical protein [Deltaproteobacteria bacterium]
MEQFGLEQVVEELKRRGVQAGEAEARRIVAEAQAEAQRLRAEAAAEAETLRRGAREEKARTLAALQAEMAQAARVGLAAFRCALEGSLLQPVVDEALAATLAQPALLTDLVLEMVRAFCASGMKVSDLELLLPEQHRQELEGLFLQRLLARGAQGVQVSFAPGLRSGFRIGPRGGGFIYDLGDEALREVFLSFLAPRFRKAFFAPAPVAEGADEARSDGRPGEARQRDPKGLT